MRSVMNHNFSMIPQVHIPRSKFNRSHGYKTTFDASYLVPVFADLAVPGDTMNLRMTAFARLATPLTPFMDNMVLESFFFAVPIRLVWENFQRFMGEQDDPDDSIVYSIPVMDVTAAPLSTTGYVEGSLSDYLGIPTKVVALQHSSLWHRAYNLIYQTWFKDENLIDSPQIDKGNGPDNPALYVLRKRGKRHDYFTSALPWPQKGTAVDIPLGTQAPLVGSPRIYTAGSAVVTGAQNPLTLAIATTGNAPSNSRILNVYNTTGNVGSSATAAGAVENTMYPNNLVADLTSGTSYADLSTATAATINSLRQAFQLQKFFEKSARGGSRYIETIRAHFGVISPDARLQRPEFLGGGSSPVHIHPIANTTGVKSANSPTATDRYQGDLSAMGTVTAHGHGFNKSFTEHTLVLGLVNVRADLTYCQGLNRMFSYSTREDFYWPSFAHLGEQAILNKEIYAQGPAGGADDAGVFGYIPRYDEMRYKPSQLTGLFRFNATGTLKTWHLAQEFTDVPALDDGGTGTFITDDAPVDRVIAVPSQPHFLFDAFFDYIHVRPMPTYAVPGLIDHF